MTQENHKPETKAVRIQAARSPHREHSVPIFETSGFIFDSAEEARAVFAEESPGNVYTRFSNPNTDEFIAKMCALEGAEDGIATSSGMAAIFLGMISLLRPGDHVLSARQVFGTTHLLFTQVLTRWGISHSYVDLKSNAEWEAGVLPTTRVLYCETPSNPGLELGDLKFLARLARKHDLYLVVDNCFASPYLQNPLGLGADLVIHSATKYLDGQGRSLAGAILGNREVMQDIRMLSKITGPVQSPFTSWLLSKSLETLSVRMDRHCANALAMAAKLESHKEVSWVRYPFLPSHPQVKLARRQMKQGGGLLSFELKGGEKRATLFIDALQMITITSNLGDSRSIITHPASTTHSKLTPDERKACSISEGMVRLSVGLEHIDDIWNDVEQAIQRSK